MLNNTPKDQELLQTANEACTKIKFIIEHLKEENEELGYQKILDKTEELKSLLTDAQTINSGVIIHESTIS